MKYILLLLLTFPFFACSNECKVDGEVLWWSYDLCFSIHETDDPAHPDVLECTEHNSDIIKNLGECNAKVQFKSQLCKRQSSNDTEFKHCMSHNVLLGPATKNRGI